MHPVILAASHLPLVGNPVLLLMAGVCFVLAWIWPKGSR